MISLLIGFRHNLSYSSWYWLIGLLSTLKSIIIAFWYDIWDWNWNPLPPNPNQKLTKYKQVRTRINKENTKKFGDIIEEILKDPTTEPYPDVSMRGTKSHGYYTENYGDGESEITCWRSIGCTTTSTWWGTFDLHGKNFHWHNVSGWKVSWKD